MAKRNKHRGVRLIERRLRSGKVSWIARWQDPDSGRTREVSMARIGKTNAESRRVWAMEKSSALADRRAELARGAPRRTETPLSTALDDYLRRAPHELRPGTVRTYRAGLQILRQSAAASGIATCDDLNRPRLAELRDHLICRTRRISASGEGHGVQKDSGRRGSRAGTNKHLRTLRAVLNDLRRRELLPFLRKDDIADGLRPIRTNDPAPQFLTHSEIRGVLAAAIVHDREASQHLRAGAAPPEVAPLVVAALLTGARINELLSLRWSRVDFAAGMGAGEIRFDAKYVKTGKDRTVHLDCTPMLRELLALLSLRRGSQERVFPLTESQAAGARKRLERRYSSPKFTWQGLRRTCATYSVNARGVFGTCSLFASCQRLGHAAPVSMKHYTRLVRVPEDARTLEAALGIEDQLRRWLDQLGGSSRTEHADRA